MPQGECRLSDQSAQRCVEQELRLLTEEGQERHGQLFANVGQSWNETEFSGHPELGPDETQAPHARGNIDTNDEQRNNRQPSGDVPTGINNDHNEPAHVDGSLESDNERNPIPPGAKDYEEQPVSNNNNPAPANTNSESSEDAIQEDTESGNNHPDGPIMI